MRSQDTFVTPAFRGAIIGLGFISGKGHLPAYLRRTDTRIEAIADVCPERLAYARTLLPEARLYASAAELFESEKDLDFVDISTPPVFHAPLALEALQRGFHVLCEKPLTATLEQAQELLKAAQKYKRVVFPCHNYKHAPVVKAVNEIIASGEIGEVTSLAMSTYRTTHAKGVKEWKTDWRRMKELSGGGIAMDHGSHTFYLTFQWLRALPTAVTAKMLTMNPKWDTEDCFSCVLTFPTGITTANLTWTAGTRKVVYNLQGTKGAIMVDDDDIQVASKIVQLESTGVSGNTRRFSIASHWGDASHVEWFNSMFDQFRECIAAGDFVNAELKEAYHCIQIITKAYESSDSGCLEKKLDTSFSFLK